MEERLIKETVKTIVSEYINPVMSMPGTDEEEFYKWYDIVLDLQRKLNTSFFWDIINALINEAVVPGRNLGCPPNHTLLSYDSIKSIMNNCYKVIVGNKGSKPVFFALRKKYSGVIFAQRILDAYEEAYSVEEGCH